MRSPFKWLRRTKPAEPKPTHVVQLHRAVSIDGGNLRILNSWGAIPCFGWDEALRTQTRLYQDNQWGSETSFPYVTIVPYKAEEQA